MMESFIDTDTITDDEELLKALKHNNKVLTESQNGKVR